MPGFRNVLEDSFELLGLAIFNICKQLFLLAFGESFLPYELLFRVVGQSGIELHDSNLYFLIQPSDLQSKNFSNVLFYSDR